MFSSCLVVLSTRIMTEELNQMNAKLDGYNAVSHKNLVSMTRKATLTKPGPEVIHVFHTQFCS